MSSEIAKIILGKYLSDYFINLNSETLSLSVNIY